MKSLHHLLVFESVARLGSVTLAARELSVSQPAVSKQVKQLERSVGVRLLEREGRGVRLAPAGRAVAARAQRMLAEVDAIPRDLADLSSLRSGQLAVGAAADIATYLLPDVSIRFRRKYPGIDHRLEVGSDAAIARGIAECRLDVGLCEAVPDGRDLVCKPLMSDPYIAIAAPARSSARPLSPRAFFARPLIALSAGDELGRSTPRPSLTLPTWEAVKRAVAADLGVAIVPRLAVADELRSGRLSQLPLRGLRSERTLCLVRRAGPTPTKAMIAFHTLLRHAARGTLPDVRAPLVTRT